MTSALPSGDKIARNIATRMVERRTALGLSLQEVADRCGLSKSHIWDMEQGHSRNPTVATAVAVASTLGVSLDHLTGIGTDKVLLHPEALRIACEIDALIRRTAPA